MSKFKLKIFLHKRDYLLVQNIVIYIFIIEIKSQRQYFSVKNRVETREWNGPKKNLVLLYFEIYKIDPII